MTLRFAFVPLRSVFVALVALAGSTPALWGANWMLPANERVVDPSGKTYVLLQLQGSILTGTEPVEMSIWEASPDLPVPRNLKSEIVQEPFDGQYTIGATWREQTVRRGDRQLGRAMLPRMPWRTFVTSRQRGIVTLGYYGPRADRHDDCAGVTVISHDGQHSTCYPPQAAFELRIEDLPETDDKVIWASDGWLDDDRGRLLVLSHVLRKPAASMRTAEMYRIHLTNLEIATGRRVAPRDSVLSAIRAVRTRAALDLFDVDICREHEIPDREFEALIEATPQFDGVSALSAGLLRERGHTKWNNAIETWRQEERLDMGGSHDSNAAAHWFFREADRRHSESATRH